MSERKVGPEGLEVEPDDEVAQPAGDRAKVELPYEVIPEAPWSGS